MSFTLFIHFTSIDARPYSVRRRRLRRRRRRWRWERQCHVSCCRKYSACVPAYTLSQNVTSSVIVVLLFDALQRPWSNQTLVVVFRHTFLSLLFPILDNYTFIPSFFLFALWYPHITTKHMIIMSRQKTINQSEKYII